MNLEADRVGIAILERLDSINVGDTVTRTKSELRVPVGDAVRGRVVDGLGNPLDGNVSRPAALFLLSSRRIYPSVFEYLTDRRPPSALWNGTTGRDQLT